MREYLIITKSWPPPQQPRPTRPPPPLCNNLIPSRFLGKHRDAWIFLRDTRYSHFQHFRFCSVWAAKLGLWCPSLVVKYWLISF